MNTAATATTTQELEGFLLETPEMVIFYRSHLTSRVVVVSPDTSDRKPSTLHGRHCPISLDALEDADKEVSFVGELLRFAISNGVIPDPRYLPQPDVETIPRLTLSAFWWAKTGNRRCLGLAGNPRAVHDLAVACRVLAAHSEEIVSVMENFNDWFSLWRSVREQGLKIVSRAHQTERKETEEETVWLTVEQASLYSGRSVETITTWMKQGLVESTDEPVLRHRMITEASLLSAMSLKKIAMRNNLNKNLTRNQNKAS